MKSFTLHAIDEQLANEIKRRANELSISMNELAKRILAEGLGIKTPAKPPHRDDFASFCGTWSEQDLEEFRLNTADMAEVNDQDWR